MDGWTDRWMDGWMKNLHPGRRGVRGRATDGITLHAPALDAALAPAAAAAAAATAAAAPYSRYDKSIVDSEADAGDGNKDSKT